MATYISQWLQCSPPWLLMSGLSSHFFYYSVFSILLSEASVIEILLKWLQDFNSLGNHCNVITNNTSNTGILCSQTYTATASSYYTALTNSMISPDNARFVRGERFLTWILLSWQCTQGKLPTCAVKKNEAHIYISRFSLT